jgi:hypothetical protein
MPRVKARDYAVGKGKPPSQHQFKKGRSGNPTGRPKGPKNMRMILNQVLDRKMNIVEGGAIRRVTIRSLILNKFAMKAMKGDGAALNLLLRFKEYAKSKNEFPSLVIQYEPSEEKGTAGREN